MSAATTLTLYVGRDCHLCEIARAELARLRAELGFEVDEIDITGVPELEQRYREWLPVIELDGRAAFRLPRRGGRLRGGRLADRVLGSLRAQWPAMLHPLDEARVENNRVGVGVAARLSRYLQVLTQAKKMGKDRISSQEIADYTNINATQIRRDLSNFGKFGKRGVGYSIDGLLVEIRKILRTQGQHNIALVGAGHLGKAIAGSSIFGEHGITIAAVFDTDETQDRPADRQRRGDRVRAA